MRRVRSAQGQLAGEAVDLTQAYGLMRSSGESDMPSRTPEENFVEQRVTYTLEVEGRSVIIEHVPARVSLKTGERFFSPDTVEQLQKIVWEKQVPSRVIETPVFEFPGATA